MQLQAHFHNPTYSGDPNPPWELYTSSLMYDCMMAHFLCAHMLSVSTTILYYGPEEATVASVAAVTACMSSVGLAHVCCIRWHLKSVHQNPDAFEYWCKTSARHQGCTYRQTESLIAAPTAWILWSIASFMLLMGLVIQHFPAMICVEDNAAKGHDAFDVLNEYVQCRTLGISSSPTHLPQTARIVTITVLLVGTLHIGFNVFYFTMLGVPEGDVPLERPVTLTAVPSSPRNEDMPACATPEVNPDVLPDIQISSPPQEDLPCDSKVQEDVIFKQRPLPRKRSNKLSYCNVQITMFKKERPGH